MSYEAILKRANALARSILYEPIYGSRGGDGRGSVSGDNRWILITGFWNDNGIWIDTENWID